MKFLKRVAATPLPKHEGEIIDSFDAVSDEKRNAPSINAVKNYVANKINELKSYVDNKFNSYKLKGDFAVISGSISKNQGCTINYPNGFNKDNCVVISAAILYVDGWECSTEDYVGEPSGHLDLVIQPVFRTISLENANITLKLNAIVGTNTYSYKVVLMKV